MTLVAFVGVKLADVSEPEDELYLPETLSTKGASKLNDIAKYIEKLEEEKGWSFNLAVGCDRTKQTKLFARKLYERLRPGTDPIISSSESSLPRKIGSCLSHWLCQPNFTTELHKCSIVIWYGADALARSEIVDIVRHASVFSFEAEVEADTLYSERCPAVLVLNPWDRRIISLHT